MEGITAGFKIMDPPQGAATCKEAFLILPGLNLDPEKLLPLGNFLRGRGCAVALHFPNGYFPQGKSGPGKSGPGKSGKEKFGQGPAVSPEQFPDQFPKQFPEQWLETVETAVGELSEKYPHAALSFLGYSMGGLLGLSLALAKPGIWHRAILISPALKTKWQGRALLSLFGLFLPGSLIIPSASPDTYRLHEGTTMEAYGALLELGKNFRDQVKELSRSKNDLGLPRQFIAFSPRDEMISTSFLRQYRNLAPQLITLQTLYHSSRPGFPNHLGIDPHSLGESNWTALLDALSHWLDSDPSIMLR